MDANGLRRAFTGFFEQRGHTLVPSAGLIPHHPRAPLFTNAGMNQFLPYFLGEEISPFPRATSAQKCVRIRGKHDDIDLVGRTTRHFTFFEMLGNFSFGDYFKERAIPLAWELVTEVLGLDPGQLWVTVYQDDDEAAAIWHDSVGVPLSRIQRMGDDNFWEMGDVGPCGPCSEIYIDRGPSFGAEGGPAHGGEERYLELWNLVFMQYERQPSGELLDLPRRNIDTGAGLERVLTIIEGAHSVWESSGLRPLIARAESVTGRTYGDDAEVDVALRILADHARSMTFLVNDGVFPSNEDRGYVLRRIIRRAVRQAFRLGVETQATPPLVETTVELMSDAYPELAKNQDFILGVISREEARFRTTLRSGLGMLEAELAQASDVSGGLAFLLHDTHGFPIELTREIAAEAHASVDEAGFAEAMERQRSQSRLAGKARAEGPDDRLADYRELLEQFGTTDFVGYHTNAGSGRVLGVYPLEGGDAGAGQVELFLDRSPFYPEGGGQVGDRGLIRTDSGVATVLDTTSALPGLIRHRASIEGVITPGQVAETMIDVAARDATRRNHTATHLLHWALREVLGPHVKQAGSLVSPDRLRFDFSHYGAVSADEVVRIEDLVNGSVLADEPVRIFETTRAEAAELGAIAFFDEKYGEVVRVIEAGAHSKELCGGTHVSRLGQIGLFKVVSEGSIGSNLRRLEAVTGWGTLERLRRDEATLGEVAMLLRAGPDELTAALDRRLGELRAAQDELKSARQAALSLDARTLAAQAVADGGAVVARRDGLGPDLLRELATKIRSHQGVRAVVLGGSPADGKVSLVAAVAPATDLVASELIAEAATIVGGGGGRQAELAMAGGRDPSRLDEALQTAKLALGLEVG